MKTLRYIGGAPDSIIYGLAFSLDGKKLYVASGRGFFVVDPKTFAILDKYILSIGEEIRFEGIAGISPDEKYAAILYGKENLGGWATLFFWDIQKKKVIQKIEGLDTITSGFVFIYPPAMLTPDWKYLLAVKRGGFLELYRKNCSY